MVAAPGGKAQNVSAAMTPQNLAELFAALAKNSAPRVDSRAPLSECTLYGQLDFAALCERVVGK